MAIEIIPSCQLFWCWTDQVKHSKKTKNFFFFVPVPNSRCSYRDGTSKQKKKNRIQPYQSARKGVTKTYCAMYVIVKPKVVIGICIHIIKSGTLLCENIFVWAQLTDTWDYRHSTNDEVITKWTTAPSSNTVKTICDRAFVVAFTCLQKTMRDPESVHSRCYAFKTANLGREQRGDVRCYPHLERRWNLMAPKSDQLM